MGRGREVLRTLGRVLLRIVKGLAWFIGSVLVLVLVAVAVVLWTPWGTRTTLAFAVDEYDGAIPGTASVGSIGGTLGGTLELEDVALGDRNDNPLVSIGALRLSLRLGGLFSRTLAFHDLTVDGLEVWAGGDRAQFGDLGPEGEPTPKPEGMTGPDLPLGFEGPLAIDGVVFHLHDTEGGTADLLTHGSVRAALHSRGREATLRIDALSGLLGNPELAIAGLSGTLRWTDPEVRLDDLLVVTDRAMVHHGALGFDTYTQMGDVKLGALADVSAIAPDSKLPIFGSVTVELQAVGGAEHAWAEVAVRAEPEAHAQLLLAGSIAPVLDMAGTGVLQVIPPGTEHPFAGMLAAQVVRLQGAPLRAGLQLACLGCPDAVIALVRSTTGTDGATDIDARALIADAEVTAAARIADGALRSAKAELSLPSLAKIGATLQPWLALPPVEGSVEGDASCIGQDALLRCELGIDARALAYDEARIGHVDVDADVSLQDGKPSGSVALRAEDLRYQQHVVTKLGVDASGDAEHIRIRADANAYRGRAEVLATIEPGPRTAIGLDGLEIDYKTLHVRLERPTEIEIGAGEVAIEDLRLAVNRGMLAARGVVGPNSDAFVGIERMDLADLKPLRLPVELRGLIDAQIQLDGAMRAPTIAVSLEGQRLGVDEHALGHLSTEIDLDDGQLDAHVQWSPSSKERVELRGRAKLRPFDAPRPGLVARAPLIVQLDATGLELGRLQPLLGERTIDGRLSTSVRIAGTAAAPLVAVGVEGKDLRLDDLHLQTVRARIGHVDGRVDVGVDVHTRWIEGMTLAASLPVRIAAVAPFYTADLDAPADVALALERVELSGLDAVAPDLELGGRVDGRVSAALAKGELTARADLLVRDLSRDGERIATVALEGALDGDAVRAKLQASGPSVRLIELNVGVPVEVDARAGEFVWHRDRPHDVMLTLNEADLGALGRLAKVGGLAGRVGGTAELHGTATTPIIAVDLAGRRLAFDGHPVGDVDIGVDHDGGRVRVAVHQAHGKGHVDVDADVPMALDLGAGKLDWDRKASHTVDVDVVALDQEVLAAFVAVPDDLGFEVNAAIQARGDIDSIAARGQIRALLDDVEGVDTPVAARFVVSSVEQFAEIVLGPFEDTALTVSATTQVPLGAMIDGAAFDWQTVPIVASLDTEKFPLHALGSLLPDALDSLEGRLDAHIGVDGTLSVPNLRGAVAMREGAVTVVPLRQRFDKITIEIALDRQDVRLTKLSARNGSGTASAEGTLHLERGATVADLTLALDGLPIVRPGLPLMKLSTRTSVALDARGERTEIDVNLRKTTVDVFTTMVTAPKPLPTAEGVVFTDVRGRIGAKPGADATADPDADATTDPNAKAPLLPTDMAVRIKLGDPLFVRGPQANMSWRGGVELEHGKGEELSAQGAFTADRGRINFLGQDFVIDSGRVTLPERGDLDPYIALTAITQTKEGEVTIEIQGRASRPELRLSSDPPLPESDVFALLVTGSSSGAEGEGGGDVEAKAASLLAAFQNPVLQRELQDRLGIDRVGLSFGDTIDQPIVAVGKRVSPKIYVETRYHHNAPADQNRAEIHLEYAIKPPAWTIETFIGDAAKGAVEVWWRRRFGRARAPRETTETAKRAADR